MDANKGLTLVIREVTPAIEVAVLALMAALSPQTVEVTTEEPKSKLDDMWMTKALVYEAAGVLAISRNVASRTVNAVENAVFRANHPDPEYSTTFCDDYRTAQVFEIRGHRTLKAADFVRLAFSDRAIKDLEAHSSSVIPFGESARVALHRIAVYLRRQYGPPA